MKKKITIGILAHVCIANDLKGVYRGADTSRQRNNRIYPKAIRK